MPAVTEKSSFGRDAFGREHSSVAASLCEAMGLHPHISFLSCTWERPSLSSKLRFALLEAPHAQPLSAATESLSRSQVALGNGSACLRSCASPYSTPPMRSRYRIFQAGVAHFVTGTAVAWL